MKTTRGCVMPGEAWDRPRARDFARRFLDGVTRLPITLEGGPAHGECSYVPHIEWSLCFGMKGVRLVSRPHPPGELYPDAVGIDLLGCYAFDRDEEVMRWLPAPEMEWREVADDSR